LTEIRLTVIQHMNATRRQHQMAARRAATKIRRHAEQVDTDLGQDRHGMAPGRQLAIYVQELLDHLTAIAVIDEWSARLRVEVPWPVQGEHAAGTGPAVSLR
jgi:hypothetical protein